MTSAEAKKLMESDKELGELYSEFSVVFDLTQVFARLERPAAAMAALQACLDLGLLATSVSGEKGKKVKADFDRLMEIHKAVTGDLTATAQKYADEVREEYTEEEE